MPFDITQSHLTYLYPFQINSTVVHTHTVGTNYSVRPILDVFVCIGKCLLLDDYSPPFGRFGPSSTNAKERIRGGNCANIHRQCPFPFSQAGMAKHVLLRYLDHGRYSLNFPKAKKDSNL